MYYIFQSFYWNIQTGYKVQLNLQCLHQNKCFWNCCLLNKIKKLSQYKKSKYWEFSSLLLKFDILKISQFNELQILVKLMYAVWKRYHVKNE